MELVQGEGRRKEGAILGIDVHKDVLACCIVSETQLLVEVNHANTRAGINKVIALCRQYTVQSAAMEATSTYHFKLLFALLEAPIPVLLANPQQTAATQGKKTDKLDARRIAVAHRDGRLKPSVISPKEIWQLRRSMRTLLRLIQDQTKCKQRLNQLFHQYDCTLHRQIKTLFTAKWALQLLRACLEAPSHKMISELVETYYPRSKTKYKPTDQSRVRVLVEDLTDLHKRLQRAPLDRLALQTELAQLQLFETLAQQHRLTYYVIAKENPRFRRQLGQLLSVPGIGPDTAAIILAEVVDISYFASPAKLAKWAGLAPRVFQSGHRKKVTGRIHKGGNKYVRRALALACTNIYSRGDETHPIYRFIKGKYEAKGAYWLAICAGARKLLSILWILLKYDRSWQPPSLEDPALLQILHQKIAVKIRTHERTIARYEKTQAKLTQLVQHHLDLSQYDGQDPKELLQLLLHAV